MTGILAMPWLTGLSWNCGAFLIAGSFRSLNPPGFLKGATKKKGGSVSRAAPQPNHLKQNQKDKLRLDTATYGASPQAGATLEVDPGVPRERGAARSLERAAPT